MVTQNTYSSFFDMDLTHLDQYHILTQYQQLCEKDTLSEEKQNNLDMAFNVYQRYMSMLENKMQLISDYPNQITNNDMINYAIKLVDLLSAIEKDVRYIKQLLLQELSQELYDLVSSIRAYMIEQLQEMREYFQDLKKNLSSKYVEPMTEYKYLH